MLEDNINVMVRIFSVNNNKNINFKAFKVAETTNSFKNFPTDINIYKLSAEDSPFLDKLRKTDYLKLYPKIGEMKLLRWQHIFDYCIFEAKDKLNTTYLAVSDNKPCAIMIYKDDCAYYLKGICAIPTETNKKVAGAGKTLFYQLFKNIVEENKRGAILDAVIDGPFDVVKKYEELGFLEDLPSKIIGYSTMTCNKFKAAEQLKKLSASIEYRKCNNEKTDLNQFTD